MPKDERLELIRAIEEKRSSRLVTYVLSDRVNAPPALIVDDAIRPIHRQLEMIGRNKSIDLFLYTRGGSSVSSFRIAKLIREYCSTFSVLVPFRAHSGGTQICLGADSILMGPLAELSPIDPRTTSSYNPIDQRGRPIPIGVEDVTAFLDFCIEEAKLKSETSRLETIKILTTQAPPLALGNVARVYDESRLIANELLSHHIKGAKQESRIERITRALTEEYTHEHYFTRDKAIEIGLNIVKPDQELESLMTRLFEDYEEQLRLCEPFDPESILGQEPVKNFHIWYGLIESLKRSYVAIGQGSVSRPVAQPQRITLPGMPGPVTVVPHPSSLPVSVKFKDSKWVELSEASASE